MKQLTSKQQQVFATLKAYISHHRHAPSIAELQDSLQKKGLTLASRRSIVQYLETLEAKGLIARSSQTRGIRILSAMNESIVSVPILGAANAGMARAFAEEYAEGFLKISKRLLAKQKNVFALRVEGNSLNRANINGKNIDNGDWVIIDKDYVSPRTGDYILSIIDGVANLKKLYIDKPNQQVLLMSESSEDHPPIVIHPDDKYLIGGRVVQVIKRPRPQ